MTRFEKVSRFADVDFAMPARKTLKAAGYDMVVAEDIVLPSVTNALMDFYDGEPCDTLNLSQIALFMRDNDIFKPTLVPSGVKCQLEQNEYLELSVRSSTPLKYGIIMANSVGIIDADYYNNESNEGHIFFQLYNLTPFDILLRRNDCICQGIIKNYQITIDDNQVEKLVRDGGLGSTDFLQKSIYDKLFDKIPSWIFPNKENLNG